MWFHVVSCLILTDCVAFNVVSYWFHVGFMCCFMCRFSLNQYKQLIKKVLNVKYTRKEVEHFALPTRPG